MNKVTQAEEERGITDEVFCVDKKFVRALRHWADTSQDNKKLSQVWHRIRPALHSWLWQPILQNLSDTSIQYWTKLY